MARPRRVRALLPAALSMALAAGAALGVSRPPDPLDGVKTSIRLKNFTAAATELQKPAAAGNPDAQYLLAVFYLNGVNGPRDPATAKTWLEKAANKGSARAAFSLATLLQDSSPPDPQGASRWLARARELGFFNTLNSGTQKSAAAAQKGAAAARPGPPSSLLPAAQLTDPAVRREALWLAASDGDVASLEALVDPALVAARDEFGRGALARAAEAASAPAVALLIRRGAPVEAPDQNGTTPLMSAAPRDGQEWSALDFAEVSGATGIAARLREKGATALHRNPVMAAYSQPTSVQRAQRDLYAGWPDLAVAAGRENPELLRALLSRGADPNALTPDGLPILTVAALSGTAHEVEALLAAGAKGNRADRRGNSALLDAVRIGRQDIVAAMLTHGVSPDGRLDDPEPPLIAAAKGGHAGIVRALLAARAKPDARDEHGTSALMLVAQRTDPDLVQRLLDAGAAVEGVDKAGRTALWHTAHAGRLETARVLLEHGASSDHADAAGENPFGAACAAGATAVVDLMLAKGAKLEARTARGDTPLLLAANAGAVEIVDKLLTHHA